MLRRLRSRRSPPSRRRRRSGAAVKRPAQLAQRPAASGESGALDEAILDVVATAQPEVGRTRAVEILRGGRSKVVTKYSYDGLPHYGAWSHLTSSAVLARVDAPAGGRHPALHRRALPQAGGGMRVGVLASGAGTNLQAILDRVHGSYGVEVVAVGTDQPGAQALGRAERAGVATASSRSPTRRTARRATPRSPTGSRRNGVELVVLAGYMALLDPAFLARFPGRVINVHPALLPAFPGLRAVEQALDYGVKVFGVTVHFVDDGVDTGPVIAQRALELPDATSAAAVREALRPLEHDLLCEAVELIARGAVEIDPEHARRVVIRR